MLQYSTVPLLIFFFFPKKLVLLAPNLVKKNQLFNILVISYFERNRENVTLDSTKLRNFSLMQLKVFLYLACVEVEIKFHTLVKIYVGLVFPWL